MNNKRTMIDVHCTQLNSITIAVRIFINKRTMINVQCTQLNSITIAAVRISIHSEVRHVEIPYLVNANHPCTQIIQQEH